MQSGSKEFDSKHALALAPLDNKRPTVFCVGDSLMSRGVYAELLEGRLRDNGIDVNVRNLAVAASWPKDGQYLLQLAIERGARPQLVIYDVTPLALKADSSLIQGYSPRFAESYLGSTICGEPDLLGKIKQALSRHLYVVGYRTYIKDQLRSFMDRTFAPEKHMVQPLIGKVQAEISPYGWAPGYSSLGLDGMKFSLTVAPNWDVLPNVSKSNPIRSDVYTIGPIKSYCDEKGIPIVFVWLPCHPLSEEKNQESLGFSVQDCLRAFAAAASSGEPLLDLHDSDHDPRHFMDLTHMNASGAIATTESLAERLMSPPLRRLLEDRLEDTGRAEARH